MIWWFGGVTRRLTREVRPPFCGWRVWTTAYFAEHLLHQASLLLHQSASTKQTNRPRGFLGRLPQPPGLWLTNDCGCRTSPTSGHQLNTIAYTEAATITDKPTPVFSQTVTHISVLNAGRGQSGNRHIYHWRHWWRKQVKHEHWGDLLGCVF